MRSNPPFSFRYLNLQFWKSQAVMYCACAVYAKLYFWVFTMTKKYRPLHCMAFLAAALVLLMADSATATCPNGFEKEFTTFSWCNFRFNHSTSKFQVSGTPSDMCYGFFAEPKAFSDAAVCCCLRPMFWRSLQDCCFQDFCNSKHYHAYLPFPETLDEYKAVSTGSF